MAAWLFFKKKNRSSTHVREAVTGRSHLEADLWTAYTWRPPNPPNRPLPFATGHPHRHRRSPIRFLPPSQAATTAVAASPSLLPPYRRHRWAPTPRPLPFLWFERFPLQPSRPCSALLQTSRLGRAPPRQAAALSPVPSPGPPRRGARWNGYTFCLRSPVSRSLLHEPVTKLTVQFRRGGCACLLTWKQTLWIIWSSFCTFLLNWLPCVHASSNS